MDVKHSGAGLPHRLERGVRDQPSQDPNFTVQLCKCPPPLQPLLMQGKYESTVTTMSHEVSES